jgi:uncharacterized coiled-coil DUF342 family protein
MEFKQEEEVRNLEDYLADLRTKCALLSEEATTLREDNFHFKNELNRTLESERHLRKENNHLRAL